MRRQANANIKQDTLPGIITRADWKIIKCFQHLEVKIKHVGQTAEPCLQLMIFSAHSLDNVHKESMCVCVCVSVLDRYPSLSQSHTFFFPTIIYENGSNNSQSPNI